MAITMADYCKSPAVLASQSGVINMPLRQLYQADEARDERTAHVDIVAVHGLNPRSVDDGEHARNTWTSDDGRLWLRDDLPTHTPKARIFLYEYDSRLINWGDKSRFVDKANDLLEALRGDRKKDANRPLIFLAHSLGGILVQQALVNAHNNLKHTAIRTSTTGLAFFGTPHDGGDRTLVALGSAAVRVAKAIHLQSSANDVVEALKSGSLFSDLLAEHWRHQLLSYLIVSFYEGVGDIVPKKSASFGLPGTRENIVKLDTDHGNLCRYDRSQRDQDSFRLVLSNVYDLYDDARKTNRITSSLDKETIKIMKWLSSIPYQQHHFNNKAGFLEGTGSWLFSEPALKQWEQSTNSSICWLHGIPGCGKTKLVSFLIDTFTMADDPPSLAYFYCAQNKAEKERSDPTEILRSLVRQLSIEAGRVHSIIADIYKERSANGFARGPLSFQECLDLIIRLATQDTMIVIDALDECDAQLRHTLLSGLTKIVKEVSGIKLFVSSRDDKDIVLRLKDLPNLYITAEHNAGDIHAFIRSELRQAIEEKRLLNGHPSEELVERITKTLTKKSQGMFLWVSLQLQNICSIETTFENDVVEELRTLPKGLEAIYERILARIFKLPPLSRKIATRSLKWILSQQRQFSTEQLLAAVSTELDSNLAEIPVSSADVIYICCNLVILDKELNVFRFAHLSVREYLEQHSQFSSALAHSCAAKICLAECLAIDVERKTTRSVNFRHYAVLYWMDHCQSAENYSRRLNRMLLRFLRPPLQQNRPFSRWKERAHRLHSLRKAYRLSRDPDLDERRLISTFYFLDPIVLACMWGFVNVVDDRLQASMDSRGKILASFQGHRTEHLVTLGFGPGHKTCLHFASEHGHRDIVLLLLGNGAKVNAQTIIQKKDDSINREHARHRMLKTETYGKMSALHYAAQEGHEPVALSLLEHGAEVDMQDINGETALIFATASSSQAVVQLLLEREANPNVVGLHGSSPFQIAVENENATIAGLLMDNGADVNTRFHGYEHLGTALHYAAVHGCVALTRLLLDFKANVNIPSSRLWLPLHTAAFFGNTAIAKLLIDNGAYIDARCKSERDYDWTALHFAATMGHLEVAQLLLLNNADVKARCCVPGYNVTPLQLAIKREYKELIELLKAKEAEIDEEQARHPTSTRVNSTEEAELEPSFTDSCVDSEELQGDNEEQCEMDYMPTEVG